MLFADPVGSVVPTVQRVQGKTKAGIGIAYEPQVVRLEQVYRKSRFLMAVFTMYGNEVRNV